MAEPKSDFSGTDRQSDLNSITVLNADLTGANQSEEFELQSLNREIQNAVEPVVLRSRLRLALVMAALYLSLFIAALDQTIIATAVPTIAADLKSSAVSTWAMAAYLLANASAAPIWAKFSDIWGRKPMILGAAALFFGSSIICALSQNMQTLIAGRALQGTAGGGLIQLVNITISDLFSMRQRSLYLGMLEIMWAIAGGIGPILGGAFTEKLSWRWCFWINLPISGTTFLLLLLFLDVHNPKTKVLDGVKAIDWCGSLSILALTLMLLIGLEFGGAVLPWNSPTVVCLLVFGSLTILFFVYSEKRLAKYPLMPLNMLEHRSNVACLLLCFFQGMVFIAAEYYLPLYFQSALSASPLRSGLLVLPITVSEALTGIVAGVIMHRTGRYVEIIYIGTILMTIGNGLYILLTPDSSVAFIIGFQILAGVGAGFLFSPPLIALQALVSQDDTATATATFGFVRSLATSVSIVVGGTVFQNQMEARIPFLKSLGLSTTVTDALSSGGAAANVLVIGTIEDEAQQYAVKDAFARSLQSMWILYTCVAACSVIASIFIKRSYLSKEHVETKTGLKKEDTSISPVVSLGQAGLVVV